MLIAHYSHTLLQEYSEVKAEEAQSLADEYGLAMVHCSALQGEVDEPFFYIAGAFANDYREHIRKFSQPF